MPVDTSILYVTPEIKQAFIEECAQEGENDVRHLGRYLTYAYICPNCGPKEVELTPDYPYAGPNVHWTCSTCAGVMKLASHTPVRGIPKSCTIYRARVT